MYKLIDYKSKCFSSVRIRTKNVERNELESTSINFLKCLAELNNIDRSDSIS